MKRVILLVATVATVAAGVGAAGAVHAAPRSSVIHTARVFMRGMRVETPPGWKVFEDHPGEFNLASPRGALAGTTIHFWLDPIPTAAHGIVLPDVGRTPAALVAWLRHNRNFVASRPVRRRIAGGLGTSSVDLDLAKKAPREDRSCPGPCLTYFVFEGPAYKFPFGTGRGELTRLYFATLGPEGDKHTFTVAIDTPSARAFKAIIPAATRILASVRLPDTVSAG